LDQEQENQEERTSFIKAGKKPLNTVKRCAGRLMDACSKTIFSRAWWAVRMGKNEKGMKRGVLGGIVGCAVLALVIVFSVLVNAPGPLVGCWKSSTSYLTFQKDRTVVMTTAFSVEGTYRMKWGNRVHIQIQALGQDILNDEFTYALEGDTLRLTDSENQTMEYTRYDGDITTPAPPENAVVDPVVFGRWEAENERAVYTFYEDGTMEYRLGSVIMRGTYTAEGGKIVFRPSLAGMNSMEITYSLLGEVLYLDGVQYTRK
jgi:hypothetical protein